MKLTSAMMAFRLMVVLVCITHGFISVTAQDQKDSKARADAFGRIPDPKMEEIRRIRDARDWHNPIVIVNAHDFLLILHVDGKRIDKLLDLADLEKALSDLGLERWPLGRVVAVAERGLRNPGEDETISENSERVKKMLELHKVMIELWPAG